MLVCGITAAVNIKNYGSRESLPCCWMGWEAGLAAMFGPASLATLVSCAYLSHGLLCLRRKPERCYELKEPRLSVAIETPTGATYQLSTLSSRDCQAQRECVSTHSCDTRLSGSGQMLGTPPPALANEHTLGEQLAGAGISLFLYTTSWALGALSALPYEEPLLPVIFSCLYGGTVLTLGLFVLVHHGAKRDDIWLLWFGHCHCRGSSRRAIVTSSTAGALPAEAEIPGLAHAEKNSPALPVSSSARKSHSKGWFTNIFGSNKYVMVSGSPPPPTLPSLCEGLPLTLSDMAFMTELGTSPSPQTQSRRSPLIKHLSTFAPYPSTEEPFAVPRVEAVSEQGVSLHCQAQSHGQAGVIQLSELTVTDRRLEADKEDDCLFSSFPPEYSGATPLLPCCHRVRVSMAAVDIEKAAMEESSGSEDSEYQVPRGTEILPFMTPNKSCRKMQAEPQPAEGSSCNLRTGLWRNETTV
uniref:Uncharacterized protein n=1 Tax=Eptatretus burgeri TaxID=7764 RepID=A0A8C4QAA7_EPTBU